MPGRNEDSGESKESLLEAIAAEEGDRDLFPAEVLQVYNSGEARKARKLLLKHARTEPNHEREQKQLAVARDFRIWLEPIRAAPKMYTFNGIGTMLYGAYQRHAGTYIATLWFTFVFVPIWPLAAFLVQRAEGKGWLFLARTPFPPFARGVRIAVIAAFVAVFAGFALNSYWASSHLDLYIVNGFDRSVVVHVAETEQEVPPHDYVLVDDLPLSNTDVAAAWVGEDKQFESLSVDLAGHGGEVAVYNVANRAVLLTGYVIYGPGTPKPATVLEKGPVIFVDEEIDYAFVTPPDSMSVPENGNVEKSRLMAFDERGEPLNAFMRLLTEERADQALALARAELSVHPENAMLAWYTATSVLRDDFPAQLQLFRSCLDQVPSAVDLHRYYQELWHEDARDHLREEYAELLEANPDSPMYHYLAGRIEEEDSEQALSRYHAALDIDPDYAPAHRALAYSAVLRGNWQNALQEYDRFASLGTDEALEAVEPRIRIRRLLGRTAAEIDSVLSQTREWWPENAQLSFLSAHLRVERDPRALSALADTVVDNTESALGYEMASADRNNVRADLAVTAGDLEVARNELRLISNPGDRDPWVTLRFALSSGATQQDRDLLFGIPDWLDRLDAPRMLVALELLEQNERWQTIANIDDASLSSVARALNDPAALVQSRQFAELVGVRSLDLRAAAFFAAARRLAGVFGSDAARARLLYLEQAQALALPGELPAFQ
jgi:tetratricopeptide (TPR) repeat protein